MIQSSVQFVSDLCGGVLDLVYPPFCLVCRELGNEYLCPECLKKIVLIEPPYCRKCGGPCNLDEYLCTDCKVRQYEFEQARCVGIFDDVLRKAIHLLKYDFHMPVADPLAALMVKTFPSTFLGRNMDVVVPVPVHRSRLIERGFNQSEELAVRFCKHVSMPIQRNCLVKTRKTRHQVDLPQDQRAKNVEGAFAVMSPDRIAGKHVLLVDDVFTTGSTLNEAARTLRLAGAVGVSAYTLARSI